MVVSDAGLLYACPSKRGHSLDRIAPDLLGHKNIIPIRFQNMGIPNSVFSCCPCFSRFKKKRHSPNFESGLVSHLRIWQANGKTWRDSIRCGWKMPCLMRVRRRTSPFAHQFLYQFSIENILMIRFPTEDTERKNHREHRGNNSPYCINSIANWYYTVFFFAQQFVQKIGRQIFPGLLARQFFEPEIREGIDVPIFTLNQPVEN